MALPAPIKASTESFKQFRKVALEKEKSERVQELRKPVEGEGQWNPLPQER